ncbi:helix-turn-helix transcriptional regulator [Neorhizobium sp. BT27B]|uniref:helix-turn-helix domain-containing protein n=1 Tax=Neorhizobium sp. BT27B TaxID=3142625 RepID=UPI003D2A8112
MMQDRKGQQTQQQSHSQRSQTPARASAHAADRHVGRQVALLRLQSRMTQTELARSVGISVQQLQKYESARNRISASMLFEIAKAFGAPVSRLFDGLPGNGTSAPEAQPPIHEHIAFAASMEGQRLNDGLLALPPRVRHRISSFVAALGEELSDAVAAECDPAMHRQQCEEECNH